MESLNDSEPRMSLAEDDTVPDDAAVEVGTVKIRYVLTVVMPAQQVADNPVAQRLLLDGIINKVREAVSPDRVGVTAITERD